MATLTATDWKVECQRKLEENLSQCESRLQRYFDNEDNRSWWIIWARQICDAIERIERGTYGLCTGCKQPIDQERLFAVPTAEMCIDCQKKREKKSTSWSYTSTVATGGIL